MRDGTVLPVIYEVQSTSLNRIQHPFFGDCSPKKYGGLHWSLMPLIHFIKRLLYSITKPNSAPLPHLNHQTKFRSNLPSPSPTASHSPFSTIKPNCVPLSHHHHPTKLHPAPPHLFPRVSGPFKHDAAWTGLRWAVERGSVSRHF